MQRISSLVSFLLVFSLAALGACKDDSPQVPAQVAPAPVEPAPEPVDAGPEDGGDIPSLDVPETRDEGPEIEAIMIVATPESEVFQDGASLGMTPHALMIQPGDPAVTLELRAEGHKPQTVTLSADSERRIEVALESLTAKKKGKKKRKRRTVINDASKLRVAVMEIFRRRQNAIKTCYTRALQRNPMASGKVMVKFSLGPEGEISSISAPQNDTNDPELAQCIFKKVRSWGFPAPGSGSATFVYPLVMKKDGGGAPF